MTPLEQVALGISEANCGGGENPRDWIRYYLPDARKALEAMARVDETGLPACASILARISERHEIGFEALHAAFLDILIEIARAGPEGA